jgi:NAD(P)-dependent dehydrogenase (short-subunit alcohol dehydrogenase family)
MGWFEERSGLHGTVAVVTGGGGGLGEAVVRDLSANGVRIATVDIDPEGVGRVATLPDVIAVHGDARDPDVLARLFDLADERWGRLDTLVNVVGGTFRAEFTETNAKGWDAILRTNLMHVLHACSLAVPRMRAGGAGGSIVNLTTIECHRAAPGFAVYSAAKAAVEQFARTLAVEVAPDGIRVNNVAPDFTPTPVMRRMIPDGGALMSDDAIRAGIPMGRAGEVTDVSGAVVYLASALSSYVTGTTIHPDGGTFASSGWFNWPGHGWGNNVPPALVPHLSDGITASTTAAPPDAT